MSKLIVSPVKKWPGTVTLSDPLTLPQSWGFADAITAARELGEAAQLSRYNFALLTGVCGCVEKWELQGLPAAITPDNFPATPRNAAAQLCAWLVGEVVQLYQDEDIPNA